MNFHSLLRRDLQFLCKLNKIPANMTNLAMADALESLETVEGLDEYMNKSDSNVLQSPTSVAKLPPSTATRATRRKTAVKPEPQPSGLTSKSVDGELDQENMVKNVKFDVAKTPAARSTRKASAAASCTSKVQESKVQSAYSTRRSTRLLEKCMADLSLKTKETTLDKPERIEETEQEVSAQEKNPAGSEERIEDAEVILSRDLSASMEKEWEVLKNDNDTLVLEHANTETTNENKESKNFETLESLVQVDHQVIEQTIQDKDSEPEKTNTFHEETMVDQTGGDSEAEPEEDDSGVDSADDTISEADSNHADHHGVDSADDTISEADSNHADHQEIEVATQENDSEAEKINTFVEDTVVETHGGSQENDSEAEKINTFVEDTVVEIDGDSESEQEGDDSGTDSDGTISEADSNQVDHQETEHATLENDSEAEKINTFVEDTTVDQTDGSSETEQEGDDSGDESDGTISEADSYQAIQGSDIADGKKMILPESEGSVTAPTSPLVLQDALEETTAPLSPFVAESVSAQFPRPNKSASKNSAMKLVSKENSMEMMMMNVANGESKGEEAVKKNKKVEIDEENLKDVSMRQLVKLVKELSIKSSNNRTALQMLPGNNQIAE